MNKQPSSTMMTRLCWGVFFLVLLFLGFQVIPRALGQRDTGKRSGAKQVQRATQTATGSPQLSAANGQIDTSQRPNDVRAPGAAGQKLIIPAGAGGRLPETNSGPAGAHGEIPGAPKYPQVVLYDQYNNAGPNATSSQDFEAAFDPFDDELADDFVVPGGPNWNVESIDADGVYFNGPGPSASFNVRFYANSGTLPGALVATRLAQAYVQGGSTFSITISPAVNLSPGTYWVSVQARMDFTPFGQWGWTDRTVQSNSSAAWQNPGGGFGVCPTWQPKLVCVPTASGPDCVYRLNGTTGGGGTPTPTPSCTPDHYTISEIGGSIVAGTTLVPGSQCDDCVNTVALPFSYTLYDQAFNAINLSSNGNAQFTTTDSAFTSICLPWLAHDYSIFPYWDDLDMDAGGAFGIYTSVSGSAPNRIFNIEWRAQYFPNTGTANHELRLYEGQTRFDVIYGTVSNGNTSATAGVQKNDSTFDQYFCNGSGGAAAGGQSYILQGCGPTPTPTPSCTPGQFQVLIAFSDLGVQPVTLHDQIAADPDVIAVDYFDAEFATPSLGQLQQYDIVVATSNSPYADPAAMGNVLADYADTGGIVVGLNFNWFGPPFGLAGRWMTGGYTPFNDAAPLAFSNSCLGAFNMGHPLMQGIPAGSLCAFFRHSVTLTAGAASVASYADNELLVAYKDNAGHTGVGINAYLGDGAGMWSGP